jgi:hypothetical protein
MEGTKMERVDTWEILALKEKLGFGEIEIGDVDWDGIVVGMEILDS